MSEYSDHDNIRLNMKILQITSSLDAGGAERMAVSYANALGSRVEVSGLVVTRAEGLLKGEVGGEVDYFFLQKKSMFDLKAILRLWKICKTRKIDILHAHADSFFTATLVKLLYPRIKIVWHDHYGLSEFLPERKVFVLKLASHFFYGIIAVNSQLRGWAEKALRCSHVIYLPNFPNQAVSDCSETLLKGSPGSRVLCLANLRPQKNHLFLIEVAKRIVLKHPDSTFHLVGQDFGDDYSRGIRESIIREGLAGSVFVYGSRMDIQNIIRQSDVAILTSKSEGLPVSLLEYGILAKPVVMTAVGEIPQIIRHGDNGLIVDRDDVDGFEKGLDLLISDSALSLRLGTALEKTIKDHYSEDAILRSYLEWICQGTESKARVAFKP